MKRRTKVIAATAITLAALAADPAKARAEVPSWCDGIEQSGLSVPYYCYEAGYVSPNNGGSIVRVPGAFGGCSMQLDGCSPIPNQPGTWNPRGYTPCTYMNGCDPARR